MVPDQQVHLGTLADRLYGESLALQSAISAPQSLLTGAETAALELFSSTRQRGVVRSNLQTLKSAQVLLGKQEDLASMVVDVYLRHLTAEAKPVAARASNDICTLLPEVAQRPTRASIHVCETSQRNLAGLSVQLVSLRLQTTCPSASGARDRL